MKKAVEICDEKLITSYANGNNEAFDTLLRRYKDKVYTYILLSVKDTDLADDIFQETFIKIIYTIKQGRYIDSGKFLAWTNRIAHNLIIDHFRQQKTENTYTEKDADLEFYANLSSFSDLSIENTLIKEQTLNDIVRIIKFLPQNQQEVIQLRFFDNLSFKEISDKTGVGINTALGRMRYALQNIKKIAEEHNISFNF